MGRCCQRFAQLSPVGAFSDGAEGEVDLRDFIVEDSRPIVQSLGDVALFGALRVDLDTVVWPISARLKSAA